MDEPELIDTLKLKEDLTRAIGEPKGFIHISYREFCIAHPDVVISSQEGQLVGNGGILEEMSVRIGDIFEDFMDTQLKLGKDPAKSVAFRDLGNRDYQAKRFTQALSLYTQAICFGPPGSEALAYAYANRSAVLLQLKEYNKCLQDLALAIEADYPKKTLYKLLDRQIKCWVGLGVASRAREALEQLVKALEHTDLDQEKRKNLRNGLDQSISLIKEADQAKELRCQLDSLEKELPKLNSVNPNFPSLAKCLSVEHQSDKGRYVKANRTIKAGELLLVEPAQVAFVGITVKGDFCSHCMRKSSNPLPSPLNSLEVFCSKACLEQANTTYHPMEAPIIAHLKGCALGKAEWFLAYRAIAQKPLDFFLANRDKFQSHNAKYGLTESSHDYAADPYEALFNLVVNRQGWNSATDLFKAFTACFFIRCLHWVGYFGSEPWSGTFSETHILIAKLLVHFMEAATMNSHEICHLTAPPLNPWFHGHPGRVGPALDIHASLLNHSCDPNIIRIYHGKAIMAFASKDIQEDDEVTSCYITESLNVPLSERKRQLKVFYNFHCHCTPCEEKWPPRAQFPSALADLKAHQMKIPVEEVSKLKAVLTKINQFGVNINLEQKKENYKVCLSLCIEFLQLLDNTINRPHQFFEMTTKAMFMSLWALHGSKSRLDAP